MELEFPDPPATLGVSERTLHRWQSREAGYPGKRKRQALLGMLLAGGRRAQDIGRPLRPPPRPRRSTRPEITTSHVYRECGAFPKNARCAQEKREEQELDAGRTSITRHTPQQEEALVPADTPGSTFDSRDFPVCNFCGGFGGLKLSSLRRFDSRKERAVQ